MRRAAGIAVGVGIVASFAVVVPGWAGPDFKNKYGDTTVERDCGDGDTVTYAGPEKMWPPNHKLQDVSVTAEDGDGDRRVALELFDNVTDVAGGDGGPNHDPDVAYPNGPAAQGRGAATVPMQLRSERSGKGEGRTYTINWAAEFDDGSKSCTSMDSGQAPFTIVVPHDMRGGRDW